MSTAARMKMVCSTPELKAIYKQGYDEYNTIDLEVRTLDYPMGSLELLAYTIGHLDGQKDYELTSV